MTRSMSDEQILAKYGYDKEPWVSLTGNMTPPARFADAVEFSEYFPRPECIPSPDPLPFVDTWGHRHADWGWVRIHVLDYRLFYAFKPRPWGTFAPDPEFVRSEVNPILSAFRDDHQGFAVKLKNYIWMLERNYLYPVRGYTPEQVVSARVILERLARLTND